MSHKNMSTTKTEIIKALGEIWKFYEGDKLSLIAFLRTPQREDYYTSAELVRRRKRDADEIETDLDSKRAFIKQAKKYIRKSVA